MNNVHLGRWMFLVTTVLQLRKLVINSAKLQKKMKQLGLIPKGPSDR